MSFRPDAQRCSLGTAGCIPRGRGIDWVEVARTSVDPSPQEIEFLRHLCAHQRAGDLLPLLRDM